MRQNMRQLAVWLFLAAVVLLLLGSPLWLQFAVSSAAVFGLVLFFDAFLFNGRWYRNEWEPVAISGFIQLASWGVIPWFVEIHWTDAARYAILAGILNMSSLIFYVRAMKISQDAVAISIMWNMIIVLVPVESFFMLHEEVSTIQYCGIASICLGAMISSWESTNVRWRVVRLMTTAVIVSSLGFISTRRMFNIIGSDAGVAWGLFPFYSLGEGAVALCALLIISRQRRGLLHVGGVVHRFWYAFLSIESLYLVFTALSFRAVSLGPVSLVTALESLSAGFIILLSLAAVKLFRGTKYAAVTAEIEAEQLNHHRRKYIGQTMVMIGAYYAAGGVWPF